MFQTVLSLLAVAALGWLALLVVGQPIIRFFDIRRETREQLLYAANLPAPKEGDKIYPRLEAAQDTLRHLGAKLTAFSETTAAVIITKFGFDPEDAGNGLIGLSNTLHVYGEERARWRRQVERALKFPS